MDLTKLAFSSGGSNADGDLLKMLGKRAASRFMSDDDTSLSDAVQEMVSGHGGLNTEQIRRVTEAANQTTWKEMFAEHGKDARFEPADMSNVLDGLSGRPEQAEAPITDYLNDVPEQLGDFSKLEEAFSTKPESDLPRLDDTTEVRQEHEKAAAALDYIAEGDRVLGRAFADAAEKTYQMVKQAHLAEGAGMLQMARAFSQVTDTDEFAEDMIVGCIHRMKSDGIRISESDEMAKVASLHVINNDHPLLQQVVAFEKIAVAYHQAHTAKLRAATASARNFRALKDKLRGQ